MSKDPAFPFYAQDFLMGVMHLTMEERGQYITLLAYQWEHNAIPKKRVGFILGLTWDKLSTELKSKFIDNGDFLINDRLEEEREKRFRYKEKQAINGFKGGRPKKNNPNETQTKAKRKPLEDENEYEYEKEKEEEIVVIPPPKKIDFEEVANIFNIQCSELPPVLKMNEARKKAIKARIDEYGAQKVGDAFNIVRQSKFLNGDNDQNWKATFDWIIKPANFLKIIEGNYNNKDGKTDSSTSKGSYKVSDDLARKIADRLQSG